MVVQQYHCFEAFLAADSEVQRCGVKAYAHKVEEDVDGLEQAQSDVQIAQRQLLFEVGEGRGLGVEG